MRVWRRAGPWFTPVLIIVEVIAVVTGQITLGQAVTLFLIIEAVLMAVALINVTAAVRAYRGGRNRGVDRWSATEEGFARLVPARAARALLIEAKIWWGLLGWITRSAPRGPHSFRYGKDLQPIMFMVLGLLVVEGLVLDMVLAIFLGNSVWLWISLAIHLYAVAWILGFIGSLRMFPHQVQGTQIVLRDSVFTQIELDTKSVVAVRAITDNAMRRTGYRFDTTTRTVLMAYGQADIELELAAGSTIYRNTQPQNDVRHIRVSADRPAAFIAAVNAVATTPA